MSYTSKPLFHTSPLRITNQEAVQVGNRDQTSQHRKLVQKQDTATNPAPSRKAIHKKDIDTVVTEPLKKKQNVTTKREPKFKKSTERRVTKKQAETVA